MGKNTPRGSDEVSEAMAVDQLAVDDVPFCCLEISKSAVGWRFKLGCRAVELCLEIQASV